LKRNVLKQDGCHTFEELTWILRLEAGPLTIITRVSSQRSVKIRHGSIAMKREVSLGLPKRITHGGHQIASVIALGGFFQSPFSRLLETRWRKCLHIVCKGVNICSQNRF